MFNFAENTIDMTAKEILNYYRNLYYTEPQVTERGIVANAINDFFADVVPRAEIENLHASCTELARVQADTIRKFADRLKKYYSNLKDTTLSSMVVYQIEQIEKEMIGDK